MSVNKDRIATKLAAIQAKNLQQIIDLKIYIPKVGIPTNTTQIQNWLNPCITTLNAANTMTNNEIVVATSNLYNQLCTACKTIIDNETMDMPCDVDYNRVRAIWLYQFVTEP